MQVECGVATLQRIAGESSKLTCAIHTSSFSALRGWFLGTIPRRATGSDLSTSEHSGASGLVAGKPNLGHDDEGIGKGSAG